MLKDLNEKENNVFNKIIIFNHKGVQKPISILDIQIKQDNEVITLKQLLENTFLEIEKLKNENTNLKNEITTFKNQVAQAIEILKQEINKKGVL